MAACQLRWDISSVFKQFPLVMDNYDTCTTKLLRPPLPSLRISSVGITHLLRHPSNMEKTQALLSARILGLFTSEPSSAF